MRECSATLPEFGFALSLHTNIMYSGSMFVNDLGHGYWPYRIDFSGFWGILSR